jgi:hypothetical protein
MVYVPMAFVCATLDGLALRVQPQLRVPVIPNVAETGTALTAPARVKMDGQDQIVERQIAQTDAVGMVFAKEVAYARAIQDGLDLRVISPLVLGRHRAMEMETAKTASVFVLLDLKAPTVSL